MIPNGVAISAVNSEEQLKQLPQQLRKWWQGGTDD